MCAIIYALVICDIEITVANVQRCLRCIAAVFYNNYYISHKRHFTIRFSQSSLIKCMQRLIARELCVCVCVCLDAWNIYIYIYTQKYVAFPSGVFANEQYVI